MHNDDIEIGETVIDFDPEINEINFRRMELTKLCLWLDNDESLNAEIRESMLENASNELSYITQMLLDEWNSLETEEEDIHDLTELMPK